MKIVSRILALLVFATVAVSAGAQNMTGDRIPTSEGDLVIHPVNHATFAMEWNGNTIYVDPVGGAGAFDGLQRPDLVLITDIHGDHLDVGTLEGVVGSAPIVAPAAVVEMLSSKLKGQAITLPNGGTMGRLGIDIEAIPMYNMTEDRLQYHTKGRGNGYVLTFGDTRVYVSGDLEDPAELRNLQGIDVAFVDFDEPEATTPEATAAAVRRLAPKFVYPYNYGNADAVHFKELVGWSSDIKVRIRAWY